MAVIEVSPAPMEEGGFEAELLSDLLHRVYTQASPSEVQMDIMRLCCRPDLLHRYMNGDNGGSGIYPGPTVRTDLLPIVIQGPAMGDWVRQSRSRGSCYEFLGGGNIDVPSVIPHVFVPTVEDARGAISVELNSLSARQLFAGRSRVVKFVLVFAAIVLVAALLIGMCSLA